MAEREEKGREREMEESGQERSAESESKDLKEREYRDAQGNVHHHTRTFEEQHDEEKK